MAQMSQQRETVTDISSGSEIAGSGFDYDLFVIGGGSGGVRASRMSASYGAKVALVELPYDPISSETHGGLGGTCVLRGCVPKKILVYGSAFSHEFQDAKGFGWEIDGEIKFNWKKLIENKTNEIKRLNGLYKKMLLGAGVTIYEGFGSIVDSHTVEVKEVDGQVKRYTTKHILIATGGKAVKLNIPGKELAITSDEALSLENFPSKVVIIGAGYIAVEFAGIYSGMGAEVHMFYRKDLPLSEGFDLQAREAVARNLQARGVKCYPRTNIVKIEEHHLGLKATTDANTEFHVDQVMFATGRKPKTANLNLEGVGVELDQAGAIKVNEYSQATVPNIWAVGDVTNRINLTPVALMEGNCFAKTVFLNEPTKPDYENVAHAVFCQPPYSAVGLTEEAATFRKNASDIRVYTSSFNPMKNTVSGRQEKTFMKLVVDNSSDKVLGAMMVGPDAPEIIQGIAIALKCGATKQQFDATVGIHPTAAEEFVTMRTLTRFVSPGGIIHDSSK